MAVSDEEKREGVLRSLGIKRRSAAPEKAEDEKPAAPESSDESFDPLADMQGTMAADPDAPVRDPVLGIKRRSGPTAEPKPAAERRAPAEARVEKRDGKPVEKKSDTPGGTEAPKLGAGTADQLLANILRSAEAAAPYMKGKYVAPFPEEFLAYQKTHGWYMGDGKGDRKVKVGSRLAGVVFAVPTPWQFTQEKIPAPVMTEDGFEVGAVLNKLGFSYHYVAFKLAEGQEPPQLKNPREKANRESGRIAGLKRRQQP